MTRDTERNEDAVYAAIAVARGHGVVVTLECNEITMMRNITARIDNECVTMSYGEFGTEPDGLLVAFQIAECVRQLLGHAEVGRVAQLEAELSKYKATVKRMAFDAEMNADKPTKEFVVDVARVHYRTLGVVADMLMDHGVITTHELLLDICQQIREMKP